MSALQGNVHMVLIDGKIAMKDGEILGIDEVQVTAEVKVASHILWKRFDN